MFLSTVLAYFGLMGYSTVATDINSLLREQAAQKAQTTISECRDAVICTLAKINQQHLKSVSPNINNVNYKVIKTMQLGDHECEIGMSDIGYYVIAVRGALYLAGKTTGQLDAALEAVQNEYDSRHTVADILNSDEKIIASR